VKRRSLVHHRSRAPVGVDVSRQQMDRVTATALFVAGFVITAVALMAVSVYGFDQYERAWGRGNSFQVVLWIIIAAGVVNAFGFVFGANTFRVKVPWWKSFFFGAAFTLVFSGLAAIVRYLGLEQNTRLLILAFLSFAASFLAAKLLAKWASSANRTPHPDAREASQLISSSQPRAGGRERWASHE